MSIDLINDRIKLFGCTNWRWVMILSLAEMYGWFPKGTQAPFDLDDDKPWNKKNYSGNDGQVVSAQDAWNIADAIEAAIHYLVPADALTDEEEKDFLDEIQERIDTLAKIAEAKKPSPAITGFSLDDKEFLMDFVEFCRMGRFFIF